MIRLVLAIFLGLCGLAQAQGPILPGPGLPIAAGGFTPSCSQSTAFLARATAVTNNTDKTNYDTLICGLETDAVGCSNTLDFLYILAAPDSATYLLNLCSASFALTANGTGTFTASQGWAGNGSTGYQDTSFTPSTNSAFATQDNTSFGVYIRTSRASNANTVAIGGKGAGSFYDYIVPLNTTFQFETNGAVFPTAANSNAQGAWSLSRTSNGVIAIYHNSSATPFPSGSAIAAVSSGVVNGKLFIGAFGTSGTAGQFSTDQIASAWFGAGLSAANAVKVQTRVNTFMTAYGTNVY